MVISKEIKEVSPPVKQNKKIVLISNKSKLRKELENPYYNEDFLDGFDLPKNIDVSAVIPTYNRCPHNPKKPEGKLNPLYWCIESLINQKPRLNEIIVINDNSNDYTLQVVRDVRKKAKEKGIKFVFLVNKKNRGSSVSRNVGVKRSTSNFVFFMDDDCIAKKYSVFGLYYTFKKLSEEGLKVGVIQPCYYTRFMYPLSIIKTENIGKLNLEKGMYAGNYEKFPKNYLGNQDKFLDEKYKILKPLQIQNLACCFLVSKKRFLSVGGFPDFFTWKNAYGEETELACRIMSNGYSLFFCPDTKFGFYHGKYGESSKIPLNRKDFNKHKNDILIAGMPLYKINDECGKSRLDTGNRVSTEEWYYSRIISFLVIFYSRNVEGALNWASNTHKMFVEENKASFGGGKWSYIEDKDERERIWHKAILDGLELVTKKDRDEMWNFLKDLEKIRGISIIDKLKIFGKGFY